MSVNFGFSFPALAQYGGGGNNPFGQLGPTLDMSFVDGATGVTNLNDPNGYTLTTNFITPEYQVAAQYTIWETNVGLVSKTFADIITFTRASSATFVGSNGLIQSATTNTPRFDYDPVTLAAKGLLIEEQRTNLLIRSDDFSAWAQLNVTVTADSTVSPDGTSNADTIALNAGTATKYVGLAATGATVPCVMTVYAKVGTHSFIQLMNTGDSSAFANFDISTGVVGTKGGKVTSSISAAGNGWYRCVAAFDATATITTTFRIYGVDTASSSYGGNATSTGNFFLWGAQLEAGSFATSYIPTVASQVTRAVDYASVNTLSPWFNASSGTFYAETDITGAPNSNRVFEMHDGTENNRLLIYITTFSTKFFGSSAGTGTEAAAASSVPTSGVPFKVAGAFTAGEYAISYNGGTVATAAPAALPIGLSAMALGERRTGAQAINGHLRRVTFYPRRLSNAELVSITS